MNWKLLVLSMLVLFAGIQAAGCAGTSECVTPAETAGLKPTGETPSDEVSREGSCRNYREADRLAGEAMLDKFAAEQKKLEAEQKYETALALLQEIRILCPDWRPAAIAGKIKVIRAAMDDLRRDGRSGRRETGIVHSMTTAPAVGEQAPAAAASQAPADAPFIGHKGSKKLHRADCEWARKISSRNRRYFNTYREAIAAGFNPGKSCKPDQAGSPAAGAPVTPAVSTAGTAPAAVAAPSAATPGAVEAEYLANRKGKTFHRPGCKWGRKISEKNLVKYKTREEATVAGKKSCNVCKP